MILLPRSPSCWDYISVTIWTQFAFTSSWDVKLGSWCWIFLFVLLLFTLLVIILSHPLPTPPPSSSPSSLCPRDWDWSQNFKHTKKPCYHWATSPIPFFSNRHFIATNIPLSITLPKFTSFSIIDFVLFNSKCFIIALVIFFQLSII